MHVQKEMEGREERFALLSQAASNLMRAADTGQLNGGRPYRVQVDSLSGPRVGVLYVRAGIADIDKVYTALNKKDCAAARQLFPWSFEHIACFFEGNRIRLEANWPNSLQIKDVRLSDVGIHPNDKPNVFFPGINEHGDVIAMTIDDSCPHMLVGGGSGMGKSVLLQSLVAQAAGYYPNAKTVLVDGKQGDGLFPVAHAQGQVGPVATTMSEIRAAISWILEEMKTRYNHQPASFRERGNYRKTLVPIFLILDEIQEVISQDLEMAGIVRKLAAQSRAVNIHLFLATQKPLVSCFQDSTTKSNVPGRLALRTVNYKDSEVVVGSNFPRADWLQPWEAWVITPMEKFRRTQLFNMTEKELSEIPEGKPEMDSWPAISMAEALGQFDQPVQMNITPRQAVVSMMGAKCGMGQPTLQKAWETAGEPEKNSTKARAKRDWGREVYRILQESSLDLCEG